MTYELDYEKYFKVLSYSNKICQTFFQLNFDPQTDRSRRFLLPLDLRVHTVTFTTVALLTTYFLSADFQTQIISFFLLTVHKMHN
jgi:hypothetical protein